jgi:cytochrome b561
MLKIIAQQNILTVLQIGIHWTPFLALQNAFFAIYLMDADINGKMLTTCPGE